MKTASFAGTWLVAVALAIGCSRRDGSPSWARGDCPCEKADARPVDAELLAWLSKGRSLHHLADLAENDGANDRAAAALDRLVTGPIPLGGSPEVDEVLADTYARLAELESRQGNYEKAEQRIAAGLERAAEISYFRGHLLEVRGLVLERLAKQRADEGRGAEAAEARQDAIRASLEAVRIQDEVIKRTLGDAGGAPVRDR